MTPEQRKLIEDAAEAYRDRDFADNPNGYTVASYVNQHTTSDAFTAGAEFGLELASEAKDFELNCATAERVTLIMERDALAARVKELEAHECISLDTLEMARLNAKFPLELRLAKLRAALSNLINWFGPAHFNSDTLNELLDVARKALDADKGE